MSIETVYRAYLALLVLGAFIASYLVLYSIRRRHVPGSMEFAWMMGSMFIWLVTSVLDWMASDPAYKIFWNQIGYIGVVSLPVFWVFLASRFTGKTHWLSLPVRIALFIVPLITLYYVFTGSFWKEIRFEALEELQIQFSTFIPYFWVHVGYSYALVLFGSGLILASFTRLSRLKRRQSIGVLLGALMPFAINIIYVFQLFPGLEIDFTPIGFLLSSLLYAWSLFRIGLLNLVPIATQVLIEQMNDGMLVLNTDLEVISFNQSALQMLKLMPQTLYGKNMHDILPESIPPLTALKNKKEFSVLDIENQLNGTKRNYELTIHPIFHQVEVQIGYLLVFHDTTRFKQIQEELTTLNKDLEFQVNERTKDLAESETKFRDLVEKSGVGVYLYQLNRFIYVNQTFADLFGYSREELLTVMSPRDLFAPEDWEPFRSQVDRLTDENQLLHWIGKARHRSGQMIFWDFYGNPTIYKGKWALIGTVIDVSERLNMEKILRESEERYRQLVEHFPYLVSILVDHKIAFINPGGARMLGFKQPDELIGWSFDQFILDSEVQHFYNQAIEPVSTQSNPHDGHWRTMAGDIIDVAYMINPYSYQNKPGYQVVAHDITARKRAEHRLEMMIQSGLEMNKSLELSEVLEIFLGYLKRSIHHDIGQVVLIDHNQNLIAFNQDKNGRIGSPKVILDKQQKKVILEELDRIFTDRQVILTGSLKQRPSPKVRLSGSSCPSFLGVPLVSNNQVIGLFALGKLVEDGFSMEQVNHAKALAVSAAIAIQNALLFQQVLDGSERLRILSNRLVEVQEREKRDLAHELHDEIGQELTGLQFILEKSKNLSLENLTEQMDTGQALVREIMAQVRNLSLNLRPRMLDDLGLLPTLEWHFSRYTSQTQVLVKFTHSGIDRRLPSEIETGAFRIVQESLTNVARYANVKVVEVELSLVERRLLITIIDHGIGFNPDEAVRQAQSGGLTSMIERASLLGGWLKIESAPGEGTRIEAELPLKRIIREKNYDYHIAGR